MNTEPETAPQPKGENITYIIIYKKPKLTEAHKLSVAKYQAKHKDQMKEANRKAYIKRQPNITQEEKDRKMEYSHNYYLKTKGDCNKIRTEPTPEERAKKNEYLRAYYLKIKDTPKYKESQKLAGQERYLKIKADKLQQTNETNYKIE